MERLLVKKEDSLQMWALNNYLGQAIENGDVPFTCPIYTKRSDSFPKIQITLTQKPIVKTAYFEIAVKITCEGLETHQTTCNACDLCQNSR